MGDLALQLGDLSRTRHPKVFAGRLQPRSHAQLDVALARLAWLAENNDGDGIRQFLSDFLPEAQLALSSDERISAR